MHRKIKLHHKKPRGFFCHEFPRYNDIICYLQNLALEFPENVRLEKIGKSYEGRPMYMIILQADQKNPKNAVMLEGGIHAREWLSHTTVLYTIHYIITKRNLLKYMDFYVIPCVNPDGYEYSHTSTRLWRKNMNKNGSDNPKNWGVDLNRNFPYKYGLPGSSGHRSSFMYRGKCSLSEPESKNLAAVITKYAKCIQLYIAIHCYGNLIVYPWGFTKKPISDEEDLLDCATEAQTAMKNVFPHSQFITGPLSTTMYISSGSTVDYVRGVHDIKFTYTMELHRCGKSGFTPTTGRILSVAQETIIGIEAMVKYVYNYYSNKKRHKSYDCLSDVECKRMKYESDDENTVSKSTTTIKKSRKKHRTRNVVF